MHRSPRRHRNIPLPRAQRGAVLFVALMLLIGITMIGLTAVSSGLMELRMARNAEDNSNNFQMALAAVDFVIDDPSNLPTVGPLHVPVDVALDDPIFTLPGGDTIAADARRIEDCAAPPRVGNATSMRAYSSFKYEIRATLDRAETGMGQTGLTQGYLLLGPKC